MQRLLVVVAVLSLSSLALAQSPLPLPQMGLPAGSGHAVGDFDGDGVLDLAFVGIEADVPAGGVTVHRGLGLGLFHVEETTPLSDIPKALAPGDVDGDGQDDLFAANALTGTLHVLHAFDTPAFTSVATLTFPPVTTSDVLLAGGDFDGDGHFDVVALPQVSGAPFHVFLGDGTGGFTGPHSSPAGSLTPNSLAVGDFNEDGRSDVAWGQKDKFLRVAYGQSGGLGTAVAIDAGWTLHAVLVGDANEDGHEDVICSIWQSSTRGPRLALGNGVGGLALGALMPSPDVAVWRAVDLDGDGTLDLAADKGAYFLGLGGGSFAAQQVIPAAKAYNGEPIFDLNQDGLPDYLSAQGTPAQRMTLLLSAGSLEYPSFIGTSVADGILEGLVAGDFDEDGMQDLVVGTSELSRIDFMRGDGQGGFAQPQFIATMTLPIAIASGDFDDDGHLDIVAAGSFSPTVSVYRGNGEGAFGPGMHLVLGGTPHEVIAEDLNGDGVLDIAAACNSGVDAAIVLGLGGGAFGPAQTFDFIRSFGLCSLDANGDPWRDLAFTLNDTKEVVILLGSAAGSFSVGPILPLASFPMRIAAGDLDRDGLDDLVVTNAGEFTNVFKTGVYLGTGAGAFAHAVDLSATNSPRWTDVTVVDLDGDGFEDVLGIGIDGAALFARGNGRAEFEPLRMFGSMSSIGDDGTFALADFTSDGQLDFAKPTNDANPFVVVLPGGDGPVLPIAYCVAKASSNGCLPQIAWQGLPSASATSGFVIRAEPALNQKPGLIIYSLFGPASLPLGGGTLCVSSPIRRSAAANSGGTALPAVDCSGVFALDVAAFAHGSLGGTPAPELLVPGTTVVGQWYGRDPGYLPPNNTMLSDAVLWTVFP